MYSVNILTFVSNLNREEKYFFSEDLLSFLHFLIKDKNKRSKAFGGKSI